jgi:2-methylisocitrate lyase-like PEP mutase family enzyme
MAGASDAWAAWEDWRTGRQQFICAPGVYDALGARIAAHVGVKALYLTGFGVSASLGMPDVGLTTQSEMAAAVDRVVQASGLPVVADADTGYGNPVNVARTVRLYERAGAAGFHIEDQVSPKKCGFFRGKQVIPAEEHVQKVKAACDARTDDKFVVIARTDALAVSGWDEVVERAALYREAGADLIFVDGIKTRDDLDSYVQMLVAEGIPALYNGSIVGADEAGRLGFRLQILAGAALSAAYGAMYQAFRALAGATSSSDSPTSAGEPAQVPMITDVLGLDDVYEMELRYGRYDATDPSGVSAPGT